MFYVKEALNTFRCRPTCQHEFFFSVTLSLNNIIVAYASPLSHLQKSGMEIVSSVDMSLCLS